MRILLVLDRVENPASANALMGFRLAEQLLRRQLQRDRQGELGDQIGGPVTAQLSPQQGAALPVKYQLDKAPLSPLDEGTGVAPQHTLAGGACRALCISASDCIPPFCSQFVMASIRRLMSRTTPFLSKKQAAMGRLSKLSLILSMRLYPSRSFQLPRHILQSVLILLPFQIWKPRAQPAERLRS